MQKKTIVLHEPALEAGWTLDLLIDPHETNALIAGRFIDNKPWLDTKVPRILGYRYDGDGWFQYLSGTWTWMSNQAWKDGRGNRPPGSYKRIDSKLGQAYTTAWAFAHGHSGHWYGAGC